MKSVDKHRQVLHQTNQQILGLETDSAYRFEVWAWSVSADRHAQLSISLQSSRKSYLWGACCEKVKATALEAKSYKSLQLDRAPEYFFRRICSFTQKSLSISSDLTGPTSQFLNGMHEFSEPVLARMALLMHGSEPLSSPALANQNAGDWRVRRE